MFINVNLTDYFNSMNKLIIAASLCSAQIRFLLICVNISDFKVSEVFTSDCRVPGQVEVLQEEALLRQQEIQTDSLLLAGLQKKMRPLLQQNSNHEHIVCTAQVNTQTDSFCHFFSESTNISSVPPCTSSFISELWALHLSELMKPNTYFKDS